MLGPIPQLRIATPGIELIASHVPWDTEVFRCAVAQISSLWITDHHGAMLGYARFRRWLDEYSVKIASCRLSHDRLRESMFLEKNDFRFIEMVLHPTIRNLQKCTLPIYEIEIAPATDADLPTLQAIAETAFTHERFHVDPRLDPKFGDLRYARWVATCGKGGQQLLKATDGAHLVALFLVEYLPDKLAYWHLTAISPEYQGMGYGYKVWLAMLLRHQRHGCEGVQTTISARNTAVLNLYAKLGFRFSPPEMTFHWVREETL